MTPSGKVSRLLMAFALAMAVLAMSAQLCLAENSRPAPDEVTTRTDHPVGDTVAAGIQFVLEPVHLGLSRAYFWALKPPAPRRITNVRRQSPPPPEPTPQPEQ